MSLIVELGVVSGFVTAPKNEFLKKKFHLLPCNMCPKLALSLGVAFSKKYDSLSPK